MDNDRNAPATRGNLEDVRVELKQDIAELRAEIKAELKQEVGGLRAELKQDIAALRAEAKEDNAQLRSEMQLMHDDLVERIRAGQNAGSHAACFTEKARLGNASSSLGR